MSKVIYLHILLFFLLPLAYSMNKPGRAVVDLVAESNHYQPGQAIMLGIRVKLDPSWHTYWKNPGEGGMPPEVSWKLPETWTAGKLQYPTPIRFSSGSLNNLGYENQVIFPVMLTPGNSTGEVTIAANFRWLACDDSSCVSGEAKLSISLQEGEISPSKEKKLIEAAMSAVPQGIDGVSLQIIPKGDKLEAKLQLPEIIDATGAVWFPETQSVVSLDKPIQPKKVGDAWLAELTKHEYIKEPVSEFTLVLSGGKLTRPIRVTSKIIKH